MEPQITAIVEEEAWAEHRAALDATLFASAPPIVLELRDGTLAPV